MGVVGFTERREFDGVRRSRSVLGWQIMECFVDGAVYDQVSCSRADINEDVGCSAKAMDEFQKLHDFCKKANGDRRRRTQNNEDSQFDFRVI